MIEVGSGPGDHTSFYICRECDITAVDGRQECLVALNQRFPNVRTICADLNNPSALEGVGQFEVAHCYGILYHLESPAALIATIGKVCTGFAIVETCVSPGCGFDVPLVHEFGQDFSQSTTNRGCMPTRHWVFRELRLHFLYVYVTRTQPDHPEFPVDWTADSSPTELIRTILLLRGRNCRIRS